MAETACVTNVCSRIDITPTSADSDQAHSHAREAARFSEVNFSKASEQHLQASTDFARAAKGTSDGEVLLAMFPVNPRD